MTEELRELFGNTDEVRIWSAIIPYALGNTVSEEEIIMATGLPEKKVHKFLNMLDKSGITIGKDRKMIKITSATGRAIHQLIHSCYDDKLITTQRKALKRNDGGNEQG